MRTLLAMVGAYLIAAPLLQAQVPGQSGDPDAAKGVLGPVDALGQAIRRPPPPTGPPPRLPDGTIDLGDGLWLGGGPGVDMAVGLPKASRYALPGQRPVMEDRARRPAAIRLLVRPMGVPRISPIRSLRAEIHHQPIPCTFFRGTIHTYRQIFMWAEHPRSSISGWPSSAHDKDKLVIDTSGQRQSCSTERHALRASTLSSGAR